MKVINNRAFAALIALIASVLVAGAQSGRAESGGPAANAKALAGIEKRDLVITRVFDAPVEVVWKAWTDPEYVMVLWRWQRDSSQFKGPLVL